MGRHFAIAAQLRRCSAPVALVMVLVVLACGAAQDSDPESVAAARFQTVLEGNPRRGTALDRVFEFHRDRDSLERVISEYRSRAGQQTGVAARTSWVIAGLLDWKRGREPAAIEALSNAEQCDPNDGLASSLLGQLLVADGRNREAIAALERAAARTLPPVDRSEALQRLGRIYSRERMPEAARGAWERLEKQFPRDIRVQEQIVQTLREEGGFEAALPRLEALARDSRDPSRRALYHLEIADLKLQLGRTAEGIQDLETLWAQSNPEHWLARDVRGRIEQALAPRSEPAALVVYYENWLKAHPEDLDAILRVSVRLLQVGRGADAERRLRDALAKAPSHRALRRSLIDLLLSQSRFPEAALQYAELDRYEPDHPDTLRDWGRVLLKSTATGGLNEGPLYQWALSVDRRRRQGEAEAIWNRLLATRPTDARLTAQVADLCREAQIDERALALYRRAVELAPADSQFREYLGEFLKTLGRTDEALEAWREIARDDRRTAANLSRLAEVLAHDGQLDEAVARNAEACALEPRDLNLLFKQADLLARHKRPADALVPIAAARLIAATPEERDACLIRELSALQAAGQLTARIEERQDEVERAPTAEGWLWLARASEENRQIQNAIQAIDHARRLDPGSTEILQLAARLHGARRNLSTAVELYQELARRDPRTRQESMKQLAALEEQMGHPEKALEAARELVRSVPDNPDSAAFVADLCFRLRKFDEGLQILRRGANANPGSWELQHRYAGQLADSGQIAQAVEVLWSAFDRARSLAERQAIVTALVRLERQNGRPLNSTYVRLQRERLSPGQQRDMTLLLAHAYETAGDLEAARTRLESLLTADTRDLDLLKQLRELSRRQKRFGDAAVYQRKLWELTGSSEDRTLLARLLSESGDTQSALELLLRGNSHEELTREMLGLIDVLIQRQQFAEAAERVRRLLRRYPDDWELTYRDALLASRENPAAARDRFETLLAMSRSDDEPTRHRVVARQGAASPLPWVNRLTAIPQIQVMTRNLRQPRPPARGTAARPGSNWWPDDFGQARMAALVWLCTLDPTRGSEIRSVADLRRLDRSQLLDALVVATVRGDPDARVNTARQLMALTPGDLESQVLYFQNVSSGGTAGVGLLSRRELDELQAISARVSARADLAPIHLDLLRRLIHELRAAHRFEEATRCANEAIKATQSPMELATLLNQFRAFLSAQQVVEGLDRLNELQRQSMATSASSAVSSGAAVHVPGVLVNTISRCDDLSVQRAFWKSVVVHNSQLPQHQFLSTLDRRTIRLTVTPRMVVTVGEPTTSRIFTPASTGVATTALNRVTIQTSGHPPQLIAELPALAFRPEEIVFLNLLFQRVRLSGDVGALRDEFETQLQNATSAQAQVLWLHSLAFVAGMTNDRREMEARLEAARLLTPGRPELTVALARYYAQRNQPQRVIDLLEPFPAEPTAEGMERAFLLLRAWMAMEQSDRARAVADSLADTALRASISPDLQLDMATTLSELQQYERVEQLLRSASSQQSIVRLRMKAQSALGQHGRAVETAKTILKQLDRSAVTNPARLAVPVINPTISRLRQECYSVLARAGQADIPSIEQSSEMDSLSQADALIGIYEVLGTPEQLDKARSDRSERELAVMARSQAAVPARFQLVRMLIDRDRLEEATSQLQTVFERDSNVIATAITQLAERPQLDAAEMTLLRLTGKLEWFVSRRNLAGGVTVLQELRHRGEETLALERFEQAILNGGAPALDLLQVLPDQDWWDQARNIVPLASLLLPRPGQELQQGWDMFGRFLVLKNSEIQRETVLQRILNEIEPEDLKSLSVELEQRLEKSPNWTAGKLLHSFIVLRTENPESGFQTIQELAPVLAMQSTLNSNLAWEVALELSRHEAGLVPALPYFVAATHNRPIAPGATPVSTLVQTWTGHGRLSDLAPALLNIVPSRLPDDRADKTAKLQQVIAIVQMLRAARRDWDAADVLSQFVEHLGDDKDVAPELRAGLDRSMRQIYAMTDAEACLAASRDVTGRVPLLRWPVGLSKVRPARKLVGYGDSLIGLMVDSHRRVDWDRELERLAAVQPENPVPRLVRALSSFAARDLAAATHAVTEFRDWARQPGRTTRPDDDLVCWLVARECLQEPTLRDAGNWLGERALEASGRVDPVYTRAILKEWLELAERYGDTDRADWLNSVSEARIQN